MSKNYVFSVDGTEYTKLHVLSLKRSFAVLDGENAGRTMDAAMHRDVLGTFYNYSLEIDPYDSDPEEYDSFYETISAPVDSHTVSFPYGGSTLEFEAYVSNGDDELWDIFRGKNRWSNLTVNFIAMTPQRRPAS